WLPSRRSLVGLPAPAPRRAPPPHTARAARAEAGGRGRAGARGPADTRAPRADGARFGSSPAPAHGDTPPTVRPPRGRPPPPARSYPAPAADAARAGQLAGSRQAVDRLSPLCRASA